MTSLKHRFCLPWYQILYLMAVWFSEDFNRFFIELAANNHKDWFDINRERYRKSVKEPFENFVAALIDSLVATTPEIDQDPKKCIFRINRDIRFSKDKAPYKLNRAAHISKYGRKESGLPGLYLQLGPEHVYFAGGSYQPDKAQLRAVRYALAENYAQFARAEESTDFTEVYGEVQGEENKRLPNRELTKAAEKYPIIYKKQFWYHTTLPSETVAADDLLERAVNAYRAAMPVADFLEKAILKNRESG